MELYVSLPVSFSIAFFGLLTYKHLNSIKFGKVYDWIKFTSMAVPLALSAFAVFYEGIAWQMRLMAIVPTFAVIVSAMNVISHIGGETFKNNKKYWIAAKYRLMLMATAFAITLVFWNVSLFAAVFVTSDSMGSNLTYLIAIPISAVLNVVFYKKVISNFVLLLNHPAVQGLILLVGAVVAVFNLLARWRLSLEAPFEMTNVVAVSAFLVVVASAAGCIAWLIRACKEPVELARRMRKVESAFGRLGPLDTEFAAELAGVFIINEWEKCVRLAREIYDGVYLSKENRAALDWFLTLAEVSPYSILETV